MKTKINTGMQTVLLCSIAAGALLALCLPAHALEQPPERMTYQGFLVDGNGLALGNSSPENYEVLFRVYSAQSGGTLKWSEQQTVTVDQGYFSVLLGEGTVVNGEAKPALSTIFTGTDADERFIGISVKGIGPGGSDADILPRLRLVTSPYAFMAANVQPGAVNSASIANGTIVSADIQDGSIGSADIQNDSITAIDLAPNSVTASEIAAGAVGNSEIADGAINYPKIGNAVITGYHIAANSIEAADLAADSVGASEIAANAVGASEIAENAVGSSEIAPDIYFSGSMGVNGRASNIGWYVKPGPGDTYSRYVTDDAGNYTLFQNTDGLMGIVRRVDFNQSGLEILRLASTTPNSGYDYWSLAIDTDDVGGADEDLFFSLNGSLKGWVDADGSGFKGNSDVRLKQDIADMDPVLSRAVQLQPRLYRFKDNPNGKLQVGFIAQEVQSHFPEMVDDSEEYLGLSYSRFSVIAIGAIKELNAKVETLESEKSALLQRLETLEARVQSLEQ